jgi:hypothetical protein
MSESVAACECSICYDEITAASGKVSLGCTHEFHFSCIASWFVKQKQKELSEACPLCRQEGGEKTKLPICVKGSVEDDDEDDDEDYWDDEDEEEGDSSIIHVTSSFAAKFIDKEKVATKIQAVWRSYKVYLDHKEELAAQGLLKLAEGLVVQFEIQNYDYAADILDFDF